MAKVKRSETIAPFAPEPKWGLIKIGTRLGGAYRLIRQLAQGGMGDIYLAWNDRSGALCAVKVLSPILASNEDALSRFRQEAAVMSAIRHPNVVQVLDFDGTVPGTPYMVMEYLPGVDLGRSMRERILTPAQIAAIVSAVASGLDAAHELGIVHRDLKPENIMIVPREGGRDLVKLIDFGVCKARSFGYGTTAASTLMGTPEFMSPEQARGNHDDVDPRSDQFALAVIAYMLLTGRSPWGVVEPLTILHRVVNDAPLPLHTYVSAHWPTVEAVLARGMAKAAAERFPSTLIFAGELRHALIADGLLSEVTRAEPIGLPDGGAEAVADGQPIEMIPSPPPSGAALCPRPRARSAGPARNRRRRRPHHAWEAAILLIALVCGGSLGSLNLSSIRTQTLRGWHGVRDFAALAVARSTKLAESHLSNVWKASVDYLTTVARN